MLRIMKPMLDNPQKNVAAGGIVRISNSCQQKDGQITKVKLSQKSLVIFQVLEYIRAFTAGRAGYSRLNLLMIVSGTSAVFNTNLARRVRGYTPGSVGEDMEILVHFHHYLRKKNRDYAIVYRAYPISWTEAPESFRNLKKQRNRWQRGLAQVLWKHRGLLFNPRYGRIGLFGMPFYFFFEFLGPVIEFLGYGYLLFLILTGLINWPFFLAFIALATLWATMLSTSAVLFEDVNFKWYKRWYQIATLFIYSLIENITYRQLTVWYRLGGIVSFLLGKKEWQKFERRGFKKNEIKSLISIQHLSQIVILIIFLAALFLAPFVIWQIQPKKYIRAVIIDKTVPDQTYREHRGLTWTFNHLKYFNAETRRPFAYDEDYFGFFPLEPGQTYNVKDLPSPLNPETDLIYLTDTYGVYEEEFYQSKIAGRRSPIIYGGITQEDFKALYLALENQPLIIGEFNIFGTPTEEPIRQQLENIFGVKWTGWIGRYFLDLSRANEEIPAWLIENYQNQTGQSWAFKGPGFALASADDTVVILRQNLEVGNELLQITFPKSIQERYNVSNQVRFYYWFDIVTTGENTETIAEYKLDLTESGQAKLAEFGLQTSFPAIIRQRPSHTSYYFAGDYSDIIELPFFWNIIGQEPIKRFLTPDIEGDARYFFWNVYFPLIKKILNQDLPQ